MTIAIDFTFRARRVTGMERYASALCAALRAAAADRFVFVGEGLTMASGRVRRMLQRPLVEQWWLPRSMAKVGASMSFYPVFPPAYAAPRPYAMVVYDTVPWKHLSTMSASGRFYLAPAIRRAVVRASLIFTISRTVHDELRQILGGGPRLAFAGAGIPVRGAPPTEPEIEAACGKWGVTRPFLLAVGTLEPRKNYPAMFQAMRELAKHSRCPLLVVGRPAWGCDEIRNFAACFSNITFAGYVPEQELRALYHGATALLQASSYEGLGLPILEAMAEGLPVIANDIPVFREFGPHRLCLVDFGDTKAAGSAILEVLEQPAHRNSLRQHALQYVREFTWEAAAQRCLRAFDETGVAMGAPCS